MENTKFKRNIVKLLGTVSTTALMLSAPVDSILAETILAETFNINGNANLTRGTNLTNTTGTHVTFQNGDMFVYQGNHDLSLNKPDAIIAAIDANNNTSTISHTSNPFIGTRSASIGSIQESGGSIAFNFTGAGQRLVLNGTACGTVPANDYSGLKSIDFANPWGASNRIVEINNTQGATTDLSHVTIANADKTSILTSKPQLDVITDLKAHKDFLTISQINIGSKAQGSKMEVLVDDNIKSNNINLQHKDSTLDVANNSTTKDIAIELQQNWSGRNSKLNLQSTPGKILTLTTKNGSFINNMAEIKSIKGEVILDIPAYNIQKINVHADKLTIKNNIVATNADIIVGSDASAGHLVLDETRTARRFGKGRIWHLMKNGASFEFAHKDSKLELIGNSPNSDTTFTLHNNIIPKNDGENTVILNSAQAGRTLHVNGGGDKAQIGAPSHRIASLEINGNGDVSAHNNIFAENITINSLDNSNVIFNGVVVSHSKDNQKSGKMHINNDINITFNNITQLGVLDLNSKNVALAIGDTSVFFNNIVSNQQNSVLKLSGNSKIFLSNNIADFDFAEINVTRNNNTTIVLQNDIPLTIQSKITGAKSIKAITLSGNDVDFTKFQNFDAKEFYFSSTKPLTFKTDGVKLKGKKIITDEFNNNNQTFQVTGHQIIDGQVGSANSPFGNIELTEDKTVKIRSSDLYARVLTPNDEGEVIFDTNNARVRSIGKDGQRAGLVKFHAGVFWGNVNIENDIFAKDIESSSAQYITFEKEANISADKWDFKYRNRISQSSRLVFNDNATINTPIHTNINARTHLTFHKDASILEQIGEKTKRMRNISFVAANNADAKQYDVKLASDIYSKDIKFVNRKIIAHSGVSRLDSSHNITIQDCHIDLKNNKLEIESANDVNIPGNVEIDTTYDSTKKTIGSMSITAKNFIHDKNPKFTVHVHDSKVGSNGALLTLIELDVPNNQLLDLTNIVVDQNRYVHWDIKCSDDQKTLFLVGENVAIQGMRGDGINNNVANKLSDATKNEPESQAAAYVNELAIMNSDEAKSSADRLTDVSTVAAARGQAIASVSNSHSTISHRVGHHHIDMSSNGLFGSERDSKYSASVEDDTGISSGSDDETYGVWATPFISRGTQKKYSGVSGFDSSSHGGTIGFDAKVNEELMLGTAFTYTDTELKIKGSKKGDKSDIRTLMMSVYSTYDIDPHWFVQSIVSLGKQNIKTKQIRIVPQAAREVATGRSNVFIGGAQLSTGYRYALTNRVIITPTAGVDYMKTTNGGFKKESGSSNQNTKVRSKAIDKIGFFAGGYIHTNPFDINGLSITPEFHAFIKHDIKNIKNNFDIHLDGVNGPLSSKTVKTTKMSANIGLGLNIKSGIMEYGADYDANLANKYVGHQGSVKVRVNF